MRVKIDPDEPITLFVQLKGPRGTREFRAVVDTGCIECIVPLQDARNLGYNAVFEPFTRTGDGQLAISTTDIYETDEITLEQLTIGNLVATNVKALTKELPRLAGIEGVLGVSFLRNFNLYFNFAEGYLEITPIEKNL
jgi:predicted aspartyl protease